MGRQLHQPARTRPVRALRLLLPTQRAYGVAGKEITRTTYTQIHDGRAAPAGQVQPGDLLFSRGSASAPEHVSMAIGYGYVVHARKPGRVVEVTKQSNMGEILVVRRIAG